MNSPVVAAFPSWENRELRGGLHAALDEVIDSGCWILGGQVARFEQALADYLGVPQVVALASGTDALELNLRLHGVGVGSEVVVPALCPSAVASAVMRLGARPLLVDVDEEELTLSATALQETLAQRQDRLPAAVIAVHLFGWAARWDELEGVCARWRLPLVEDASQGLGGRWRGRPLGSLGQLAALSFYPTKNLGALGDAGGVACHDPEQARALRAMRQYGWRERYISESFGVNSRMDELQAAFLNLKLSGLDQAMVQRAAAVDLYRRQLTGLPHLRVHAVAGQQQPSWHQFVLRSPLAPTLIDELKLAGIDANLSCRVSLAGQPLWRTDHCPVSSRVSGELLNLPIHPGLNSGQILQICGMLQQRLS